MNKKYDDAQIEELAVAELKKYGLYELPIDVHRLARAKNATIYTADFEDKSVSGMISKKGDRFSIYVNREHSATRNQFTIAHELGHLILKHLDGDRQSITDEQLNMYRRDYTGDDDRRLEVEANKFAASLLMPTEFVIQVWNECEGDLEAMARRFRVSEVAMGYRADHVDRKG